MPGVFFTKGMSLTLRDFRISITLDSSGESGNFSIDLRYDACAAWLRAALQQNEVAKASRVARISAWSADDEEAKEKTLEVEFLASMQAIVAAATAIDALYAIIKEMSPLPVETSKAWAKNRTARERQVTETFRFAFGFGPESAEKAFDFFKTVYKFRSAALHPTGKPSPPVFHPELNVSTEWRFVAFRSINADSIFCIAASTIWDLAHFEGKKLISTSNYIATLKVFLSEMFPNGRPQPAQIETSFWLP